MPSSARLHASGQGRFPHHQELNTSARGRLWGQLCHPAGTCPASAHSTAATACERGFQSTQPRPGPARWWPCAVPTPSLTALQPGDDALTSPSLRQGTGCGRHKSQQLLPFPPLTDDFRGQQPPEGSHMAGASGEPQRATSSTPFSPGKGLRWSPASEAVLLLPQCLMGQGNLLSISSCQCSRSPWEKSPSDLFRGSGTESQDSFSSYIFPFRKSILGRTKNSHLSEVVTKAVKSGPKQAAGPNLRHQLTLAPSHFRWRREGLLHSCHSSSCHGHHRAALPAPWERDRSPLPPCSTWAQRLVLLDSSWSRREPAVTAHTVDPPSSRDGV